MSNMFQVYQNYSDLYDELVNHEDYNNNLSKFLRDNIQWENKVVGEFGIGTGRVTRNYIDKAQKLYAYDNSEHMIDKAKVNLSKWADKIEYSILDNSKINSVEKSFDIIIEGWSFGHLVVQDDENRNQTIQTLISETTKRAKEVIFIETLGTNVDAPNPPGEKLAQFYKALVKAGFKEHVIETDYKFDNPEEAAKTMGAFFGDSMKNDIIQKQLNVIKEYTGIWIYRKMSFNLSKKEIEEKIKKQLAIEFNCAEQDFDKSKNVITTACQHPQRRKFSDKPFFLQMATLGKGTVISADEKLHPWLTEWVKGKQGIWLFEQHNYFDLETELRKHGYKMALTHHMFVPEAKLIDIKTDLKIKWLEHKDIMPFYGNENFPNAICDKFKPERPDVLAVVAMDGDKIMGMAGCSADTQELWQIGIDVLPEYRGRGIAKTLVTLLRNETFRCGAIPYYGTSLSNLASWKIALECGFKPFWVEAESQPDEKTEFTK